MTNEEIIKALREKESKDNRALLDAAAEKIQELDTFYREAIEVATPKRWKVLDAKRSQCEGCRLVAFTAAVYGWKFCPNCGRRMK